MSEPPPPAPPALPRKVARCATAGLLFLSALVVLNWRIDPLQLYRAATYPPLYSEMQRYRNPGLARHAPAPLVVMGTSASVNLDPQLLEQTFGLPALNLSMQGASAHEQYLLLRLALRTGEVRQVIWDINFEYFRGSPTWVSDYDGAFPAYLYDDSPANDLAGYLLTADTCKKSARILLNRLGVWKYPVRSLSDFHRMDPKRQYGAGAVEAKLENRRRDREFFRRQIPEFDPALLEQSFAQNCAALIREFPSVHFDLYFPPFSKAYSMAIRETAPELTGPFLAFRRMVFARTKILPNAALHDLQTDWRVVEDLSHFTDPLHYDAPTHQRVLDEIKARSFLASEDRLAAFEKWSTAQEQASVSRPGK